MAPRRSRQSVAPAKGSSAIATIPIEELKGSIEDAVSQWDSTGRESLNGIVSQRLDDYLSDTPLSSIPLSYTIIVLLSSPLAAGQVGELLSGLIDGLSEDVKEDKVYHLGEALVDAVEILEEDQEDEKDLKAQEQQMEVDEAATAAQQPGEKGIEVVKLLMASSHLPHNIPNLLFTPENLLKVSLHPYPTVPQALQRAYVKRNTTLFFKQSKYNLLRESSEGFSALVVLLTSPDSLSPSHRDESDVIRQKRAKRVWSKVMGLIGYFNLSPPRVLDLILEVASCQVASHWRFFLALLRCSPWGREAFVDGKGKGKATAGASWLEEEIGSIEHALDAGGDRVLAQVLGVKFGFYQRQDGGDTSIGLVYMAALLIKYGFVSLADLLPFLSPTDDQMDKIRDTWLKSVNSRAGPSNALSNSVLMDEETPDAGSKAEDSGPPPKPPPEQRIVLLQALLSIGDMQSALYLLGRFPWLAQREPAIADLIMRVVAYALEGLYRSTMAYRLGEQDEDDLDLQSLAPNASRTAVSYTSTLLAPSPPATRLKQFEFFYRDWADGLEQWSSIDDIFGKSLRWLGLVRGLAGRDVGTMVKICRIGAAHFAGLRKAKEAQHGFTSGARNKEELRAVEPTAEEMKPWLDVIRVSLLPALSVSSCTAAFDVELWHLLKYLPYPVRYALYGEWRDSTCKPSHRNACQIASHAAAESTRETKKALSRVTAAQTAPGGAPAQIDRGPARALAKLSHSNPHALWMTAVTQVKAYPNIGQFIVEAGRYMTQMSTDVAMFTLVDTLSDDTASRLNPNGTDVAQWLASLATFVGDFNRRYATMDLEPVLQFIINRLMRSESADLTILDKLISIMSGVSQVENDAVSDDQLQAYASGKEMLHEAFHSTIIAIARPDVSDAAPGLKPAQPPSAPFDKAKSTKKSLPRLVNALRDTQLAMPIWIALAQTRQSSVDKMASAPIKAMGTMQDTIHGTFIQYGDLLAEQLTSDEHINLTPNLSSLVSEFGLDFAMAFQILRPRFNALLDRAKAEKEAAMRLKIAAAKEEGLKLQSPTRDNTPLPSPTTPHTRLPSEDGDVQMSENGGETTMVEGVSVPMPKLTNTVKSWYPSSLRPAMEDARDLLPAEANASMGAPFFVIFWHLTMADIAFSSESYDKAIAKIGTLERDVASWRIGNKTDISSERNRLKARIELLKKEREVQSSNVSTTRRRLLKESKHWFGRMIVENNLSRKLSHQLHQHCFFPRSILTPADAVFVAKFIRMAHDLGTVGFSTIFIYSNFFGDTLAGSVFSCTNNEARNLGRCLGAMMADLDAWHLDEKLFRREALGLDPDKEGGGKGLPGMMVRSRTDRPPAPMTWNQFREFYAKAHNALAKALVSCWAESDFMHIKNAITIGLQVIKSFPVMDTNGKAIESAVKDLIAGKNGTLTPDVQHQCQAYLRTLTQRQAARPYISPSAFHASGQKPAPAKASSVPRAAEPVANGGTAKPNGESSPAPIAKLSDPKVLRAKLEETKATRANSASVVVKEEPKTATSTPVREMAKPSTPPPEAEPAATTPAPAGPRSTRSTTTTAQESRPPNPNATSARAANMGPPVSSLEADRNAARARRFGSLVQPTPPTGPSAAAKSESTPPPAPPATTKTETRAKSPTPTSRRASPVSKSRRSGSVESRLSERSRRDRRHREPERERGDRGRDRHDTKRELLPSKDKDENGHADRPVSDKRPAHDKDDETSHKQADKLVIEEKGGRRSSRDTSRREVDRDRDERKSKERTEKSRTNDDTSKRKRDEEVPRRIDDPRDRRDDRHRDARHDDRRDDRPRERRDERDRPARPDDRDRHRHRDGRDVRDARDVRDTRDPRDARNPRDPRDNRDVRDRDARDPPRERDAPRESAHRSPDRRERDNRSRNVSGVSANNGNRSPRPEERKDLLSEKVGDRIVEAPRPTTRASDTSRATANGAGRPPHALPARPPAKQSDSARPPTPPRQSTLAQRLGPAPPEKREPEARPAVSSTQEKLPEKPSVELDTPAASASDPRKRPLDETGPPSREESPGASKRVKIDRDKARGHDRKGREAAAGQNRLLANAMKGAGPE